MQPLGVSFPWPSIAKSYMVAFKRSASLEKRWRAKRRCASHVQGRYPDTGGCIGDSGDSSFGDLGSRGPPFSEVYKSWAANFGLDNALIERGSTILRALQLSG